MTICFEWMNDCIDVVTGRPNQVGRLFFRMVVVDRFCDACG